MTPERWQQIKGILIDALESASAEEEAATIDRACAHDASLRREVEALLLAQKPDAFDEPKAFRT
jgi:hypothetical protein